jgi:small-conductance mechanosensitive channel
VCVRTCVLVLLTRANRYTDRRNLQKSLSDAEDLAEIARQFLGALFWTLMVILCMLIFGIDLFKQLLPLSTWVLALGFMVSADKVMWRAHARARAFTATLATQFRSTLSAITESFFLMFFVRPFQVGDRISIDGGTVPLIVDKIHLLSTVTHRTFDAESGVVCADVPRR